MAAADDREIIDTDVVIVGAGPAGLSAAIRLKQKQPGLSVTVVEKAAEIGGHILSGAVMDTVGLDSLIPDWRTRSGVPATQTVRRDTFHYLTANADVALPNFMLPPQMKRHGAVIVSLGELCRWLGEEAQGLGVDIFPMTAAVDVLTRDDGTVQGIITGDLGRARDGSEKPGFARGVGIRAKHTLIGEGARGSLAKQLIQRFKLDTGRSPQKYGLGIKEIWEIPESVHEPGRIDHYLGYPLDHRTSGGGFAYHAAGGRLYLGFVTHLDYQNPTLSPFGEFQRFKAHKAVAPLIANGKRLSYGARAMTSGGLQSIPEIAFPGGALIGCSAGYMNVPALKGIHNAMRSGIAAADAIVAGTPLGVAPEITAELTSVRNVKPLWAFGGSIIGVGLGGLDLWSNALLKWSPFGTVPHKAADYAKLKPKAEMPVLSYAPNEGRTVAVFLANLAHDEDQPVHLRLTDPAIPIRENLPRYGEPAQLYCPAGVYEVDTTTGAPVFRIHAANCVHCKTCDIKDPAQNITWVPPEGGSGPNYSGM